MKIFQKYTFFLVLLNLLFINCAVDNEEAQKKGLKIAFFSLFLNTISSVTRTATDNMDGTVTITDIDYYGNETHVGYIKKCLQGQVYRESENDCKGTGSADDVYGAVQLQYCDTADNSCNGGTDDGVLDGGGNSEVYDSCNSETLQGKNWYAGIESLSSIISNDPYRDTIFSHIYDLYGVDGLIWDRTSDSVKQANAYTVRDNNLGKELLYSYSTKTEKNYLLCSKELLNLKEN